MQITFRELPAYLEQQTAQQQGTGSNRPNSEEEWRPTPISPLEKAALLGKEQVMRLRLLREGARKRECGGYLGQPCPPQHGRINIVQALLHASADIDAVDGWG